MKTQMDKKKLPVYKFELDLRKANEAKKKQFYRICSTCERRTLETDIRNNGGNESRKRIGGTKKETYCT